MDNVTPTPKEAIILAGGFGTRLKHILPNTPKPMAPIGEQPFLNYLLNYLIAEGFNRFVLSTGYLHEQIEAYYGNRYKTAEIVYAHETTPLGTGGAIRYALSFCQTEEVCVLNGDTMFLVDYTALFTAHKAHPSNLTIVLRYVADTSRYGSVQTDACGRITAFVEKQIATSAGYINGGIYLLNKHLFDNLSLAEPFSFEKDVMEKEYQSQSFYTCPSEGYFIDIGIPEDYRRAQQELPALLKDK